jgi:uncharacterized protein (DUF486 family)
MSTQSFLQYIPIIVSNPVYNAIILTFIPGILYVLAAYGHLMFAGVGLGISIVISIIFAALEYIVRVPLVKYSSEIAGMSNGFMQFVWVGITMLLSWLSSWFMPIY